MTNTIKLEKHQSNVVKAILSQDIKGLIVFHTTGSGKTLTSIAAAINLNHYYGKPKPHNIIVITGKSLIEGYNAELDKYNVCGDTRKLFKIYTYNNIQTIPNFEKQCRDAILIVDEAHTIRNTKTQSYNIIYECVKHTFKTIFLTATPIVNVANDFLVLKDLLNIFEDSDKLKCYVSYYNISTNTKNFPKIVYMKKPIVMSTGHQKIYDMVESGVVNEKLKQDLLLSKNIQAFLNGIRKISNVAVSEMPKLEAAFKFLKQHKNLKTIIYSNFLQTGITALAELLNNEQIPYSIIKGSMTSQERQIHLDRYNNDETNILLISASGSQGIDTRGTRVVIILESYWNQTRIDQVIGRAARFKSHNHLLPEDRNVVIYHYILKKIKNVAKNPKVLTSDEYLDVYATQKNKNSLDFVKKIKRESIEKQENCITDKKIIWPEGNN